MKWHQRSLTSMSIGGTAVYYTYNADGIRTQKTVGAGGHVYVLDGSTILKETIVTAGNTTHTLYYYYDESGISGLEYNGTKYTYVKNLQGDVIGIINANGVTVVEYKYDAWGNVLSVSGSMASTLGATNPFRYRGYYYDTESGWYYLNSRYYDPQVGRFLNADGIVGANGGIMGYNMFAYCSNNPVIYVDPCGTSASAVAYGWGTTMWWLTVIDGPLPIGDIIYGVGAACILAGGACISGWIADEFSQNLSPATTSAGAISIETVPNLRPVSHSIDLVESEPMELPEFGENIIIKKAGDGVSEHTNGKNWDKHTKKRSGGSEKKDDRMKPRIDKKKRNIIKIK
ncbi:MAG: RHS repeat-associated core domain-containing protein [Clostridia bacterium]|nr:RHS repeat-associated core domain-containing protein [Clostridia bacterium]